MELALELLPPGCVAVKALRGKSAAFVLMAEPYYPLLGLSLSLSLLYSHSLPLGAAPGEGYDSGFSSSSGIWLPFGI